MAMDVHGIKPKNKVGEYFRRSCWGWRPIADYCINRGPEVVKKCTYWHTNDGDGLDAQDSLLLAGWLENSIKDGQTGRYISERDAHLLQLQEEKCWLCEGTGIRHDTLGQDSKQIFRTIPSNALHKGNPHPRAGKIGWCNGCDGVGSKPPYMTLYTLELIDLREFASFLRNCGGFKIL